MPLATEQHALEQAVLKAQHILNRARERADELLADLVEADINLMLDRLSTLYRSKHDRSKQ